MTIQELIDEVKQEIEARDLAYRHGGDNRARHKTYQRFYLFSFLKKHNFKLQEIGNLFGLKHCTVHYGLEQAEVMKKDRVFLRITDELRQKFEQYTALDYSIEKNLMFDVLQCGSFWEMRKLQEDIKKGLYENS